MKSYSGIKATKEWFAQAIPEPTIETACVQIGCALEETAELAKTMCVHVLHLTLSSYANAYKAKNSIAAERINSMTKKEKIQMLDDIVDEIVTRIGIAHNMGFDIEGALEEVNRSNFSKFENGKPVFDANGKITKGKNYSRPDLSKFV